jgi:hypothetical protein
MKSGQSEDSAKAIVEIISTVREEVVTKSDIVLLQSDIRSLEDRLITTFYTVAIAIVGLLIVLRYIAH